MRSKTIMSSDWIEVHDHDSVYKARVFLTDNDEAYMITKQNDKKRFFRVDARLLKMGELGFFEKAVGSAKELPLEHAFKIGLIDQNGE